MLKWRIPYILFIALYIVPLSSADAQTRISEEPVDSFKRWLIHADVVDVITNESATVAVGNVPVTGGSVSMADNFTATIDVSYFLTPNFAVNVYTGYPPRAHIKGAGSLASFGTLASANYGPLTVSGEYHFLGLGAFKPYVGIGVTYAIFLNVDDAALQNVNVDNAFGPAFKIGVDYDISEKWTVHSYVQQILLTTDVSAMVSSIPASARVKINPTIVGVGIGYRF
ncbi:OmpW family outer membrane protein [Xanthobacter autotrophicus]|uniref:OmpW/AlkL family protein n=1 Tax=Xanthobacter autotrophicus TaxID=280 RepID=UPI001E5500C7|nr:OmpW family outer membrane protein [Xanthobacter autotrophicus]UDQ90049.1 outer membrane beta-barrel protein [Xanthobacter autotrophicus]